MKLLPHLCFALLASLPCQASQFERPIAEGMPTAGYARAHGLGALDGRIVAGGAGWTAELSDSGVRVTPVLGPESAQSATLELSLARVGRGDWSQSYDDQMLAPSLEGQRAIYARSGLIEWYESRERGLEQHFSFSSKPEGEGDLLVELAVETDLAWPTEPGWCRAVDFALEGRPVLRVQGVLGIDRQGRTQAGDLLARDGSLWLRLPAEFVDNAAYPLVLDPLIGGVGATSSAGDASSAAIAYHPGLDRYLAVWSVDVSISQAEIRAQVLDGAGAGIGGMLTIRSQAGRIARDPAVGFFRDASSFLVAYREAALAFGPFGLDARSVLTNGTLSQITPIASATLQVAPELAIGSEAVLGQGSGNLLAYSANGATIEYVHVIPDGFGAPLVDFSATPPNQSLLGSDQPALSHTAGAGGLFLLSWHSRGLIEEEVRNVVVRRDGTLLTPSLSTLVSGRKTLRPAVDGYPATPTNGRWLLATQTTEALGSEHDINAWSLRFDGSQLTVAAGPVSVEGVFSNDAIEPSVVWMGSKAFVAWADEGGTLDYDVLIKGVDPLTCVECEPTTAVSTGAGLNRVPAIAGELPTAGGSGDDQAVVLWERIGPSLPFDADIESRVVVLANQSGSAVSLGGGCGGGGSTGVNQPPSIGVGAFAVTLAGTDPLASLGVLNIAINGAAVPLPCGACLFEPYFITLTLPILAGNAIAPLAIPCRSTAIGAKLIVQWTVLPTATSPCALAPNLSLSDRLLVNIGS